LLCLRLGGGCVGVSTQGAWGMKETRRGRRSLRPSDIVLLLVRPLLFLVRRGVHAQQAFHFLPAVFAFGWRVGRCEYTGRAWGMREARGEARHRRSRQAAPLFCSPFYHGTTRPQRLPATAYDDEKLACVYVCVVAVCGMV